MLLIFERNYAFHDGEALGDLFWCKRLLLETGMIWKSMANGLWGWIIRCRTICLHTEAFGMVKTQGGLLCSAALQAGGRQGDRDFLMNSPPICL